MHRCFVCGAPTAVGLRLPGSFLALRVQHRRYQWHCKDHVGEAETWQRNAGVKLGYLPGAMLPAVTLQDYDTRVRLPLFAKGEERLSG